MLRIAQSCDVKRRKYGIAPARGRVEFVPWLDALPWKAQSAEPDCIMNAHAPEGAICGGGLKVRQAAPQIGLRCRGRLAGAVRLVGASEQVAPDAGRLAAVREIEALRPRKK